MRRALAGVDSPHDAVFFSLSPADPAARAWPHHERHREGDGARIGGRVNSTERRHHCIMLIRALDNAA